MPRTPKRPEHSPTRALGVPHEPVHEAPYASLDRAERDEHGHRDLAGYGRQVVAAALAESGVELGAHDERISEWLGSFDAVTAVTIASWLVRAHAAGAETARHTPRG